MKFSEMVDQAREFLRRRERVSYRVLKREFDLDDESLEDLKAELIDAQRSAVDEDGKVLVWADSLASSVQSLGSGVQNPQSIFRNPQLEAEACSSKPLRSLVEQQAKSIELRAVMSRGSVAQQGKRVEAHKMLSEIYNWFTEGFDTKDLQEAKALLDELKG